MSVIYVKRPGFLLLEALIGFALFALFLGAVGLTLLVSQQGTIAAGDRARGIALTTRALEGVRSMRDTDWNSLTDGQHGVAISNGGWVFSGTGVTTSDGFTVSVTVASPATDRKAVTARTEWNGRSGSGSMVVSEEFTNWRAMKSVGNWASPQLRGSALVSGTPALRHIAVQSGVAYVTSDIATGGPGLALFDVSSETSPVRIASSFTLPAAAHDVLAAGSLLYVATESAGAEIRIYDISSPSSFSDASLVGSYDLPGSGLARSLALDGDILAVGTDQSITDDELFLLDVSNPSDPVLQSSVNIEANVSSLSLKGHVLYLATSSDVSEIRAIDITNPTDPDYNPAYGYNVSDSTDAQAIAVTGTSALLGRANGDFIEELAFFDLENNLSPDPPPGPWYREVGAQVSAVAIDLTEHYAFVAQGMSGHELSVLDLHKWAAELSPLVAQVPLASGEARGIFYDPAADRLYVVTSTILLIYKPS